MTLLLIIVFIRQPQIYSSGRESVPGLWKVLEMPNLSNRQGTGGSALPRWPSNMPGGQPGSASGQPPHPPRPLRPPLPSGMSRSQPRAQQRQDNARRGAFLRRARGRRLRRRSSLKPGLKPQHYLLFANLPAADGRNCREGPRYRASMSALVLETGALGRKLSDFGQVSLGGLSCAGRGVCPHLPPWKEV